MARAYGEAEVINTVGAPQKGVPVDLLDPTTGLRIADTVFADPTSATTLGLPLTTDNSGRAPFFLAAGKVVRASYTVGGIAYTDLVAVTDPTAGGAPTGAAGGDLTGTYPNPTLAAGAATGTKLGADVVVVSQKDVANGVPGLDAGAKVLLARLQEVLALNDLSDAQVAAVAGTQSHQLLSDGAKWFNILHRYRPQGYGAVGDGATDDSTALINMLTAMNSAGRGWSEWPDKPYRGANLPLFSNSITDMGGATVKLPDSAAAGADVFRSNNFNTLTGGNTTGGVFRYRLMNGRIDGNRANNASGRHGIASYGIGTMENVLIHDCHGSAIWAEWSNTASQLVALGLADGDQTYRLRNIEAYDCDLATTSGVTSTVPGGISGVTNATNPTITTGQYHNLRVGQTITIAGVVGATGVNGTWSVTTVPSATTFTITTAAPGAYTSGGTITYPVTAMVMVKGADSPHLRDLEIFSQLSVVPGSVGLLLSCSGTGAQNVHVYQNLACAIDMANGNNTRIEGLYCGGHDVGIRIRQNNVNIVSWYVDGSFNNSIGLDYQSIGGSCNLTAGRLSGLTSGSINVRFWNSSTHYMQAVAVGDGGSNTSILYAAPNGTTGFHGQLLNFANGINATPASLVA